MVLPYLTPKVIPNARLADIGTSYRNYFNPKILDDVHFLNGRGIPTEELKAFYDGGKAKLKAFPAYGVSQSADQVIAANPQVRTYSGETGIELTEANVPGAGGIHNRIPRPLPGQKPYTIAIADDLDNLSALQTLGHEVGHYRMGHSTPAGAVMPDIIGGRSNIPAALKEVEAETVAAAVMNRLGYGYAPGVVERSKGYIANWNSKFPVEMQGISPGIIDRANTIATELVPEPIKRFGPLSKRIANLVF